MSFPTFVVPTLVGVSKILFNADASEIDMLNTMEKMLNELPVPRKTARGSTDYSSEAVDRVGTQFLTMVANIVTFGVDPEEDLVPLQESLQALYSVHQEHQHAGGRLHQGEVGCGIAD